MTENHTNRRKKTSRLDRVETMGLWVVLGVVGAVVVVAMHQVVCSL